jgi:predicted Rossmann fold flavoprotein
MKKQMFDVVVIGGGAAGMLASAVAAERGLRVAVIEKNDFFGKKLRITGKGRCNVTNNCQVKEVIENIPNGGKFLYGAVASFSPDDVMEMFENLGVPLKTERGRRVFPQSDKAVDIVQALIRKMNDAGVHFIFEKCNAIITENGRVASVTTARGAYSCSSAVLATGGMSYPKTGSDGWGYRAAEQLGHTIISPKGSLVPIVEAGDTCRKMQGLSLRNVALKVYDGGKKPIYEDFGELLFTHFGMSGPLALSASAHMRNFDEKNYYAEIDLKPALDFDTLDARILRDFQKYSNRDFANALCDLLNRLMIPVIIERSHIPPDTKVHSITRAQRHDLVQAVKHFRVDVSGLRPVSEAIVTSGGVSLKEINPKTMESKIVPGLFFAGEVIDADGYTGGYNLQIAWSTAHAAGIHVY